MPTALSPWSAKQRSFIKHSNAFINLAHGAVRSGKTHSNLITFTKFCVNGPPGRLGIFGKTERTVRENVIYPLIDGLPSGAVKHTQGMGEVTVMGRPCRIFTANDARAVEKVQGATLAGGYMNEATLYPEELFNMAISRSLTIENAQWFLDCNPDSPYHYLYKNFIQAGHRASYFKDWHFEVADNPILPAANVEMLKALYGGPGTLFYKRFILGLWVVAEGAIYEQWDEAVHVVDEMPGVPEKVGIGIDVGTQNATVFIAFGKVGDTWYAFDEYYHSGRESGKQKTNGQYADEFLRFLERIGHTPFAIEVDPSAADFKLELINRHIRRVHDADNSVVEGIRTLSTALTDGTFKVLKKCENLRAEFPSYVWDPKKQEKGEDAPLKGAGTRDHALDATRYFGMRVFGKQPQRALRLVR